MSHWFGTQRCRWTGFSEGGGRCQRAPSASTLVARARDTAPSMGQCLWGRGVTLARRGTTATPPRRRLNEERPAWQLRVNDALLLRPSASTLVVWTRDAALSMGWRLWGRGAMLARHGPIATPPRRCSDGERSARQPRVDTTLLLRPAPPSAASSTGRTLDLIPCNHHYQSSQPHLQQ